MLTPTAQSLRPGAQALRNTRPVLARRSFLTTLTAFMLMAILSLFHAPAEGGVLWQAARQAAKRKQVPHPTITKPAPPEAAMAPGKPHDVMISRSRYPEATRHIDQAQRQGQPSIVHIDRAGASLRRQQSTSSVNPHRKPGPHHERDEYPPALVREGGQNANVRYIPRSDNRGAGASVGAQTRHLPDGSKLRFVVTD